MEDPPLTYQHNRSTLRFESPSGRVTPARVAGDGGGFASHTGTRPGRGWRRPVGPAGMAKPGMQSVGLLYG